MKKKILIFTGLIAIALASVVIIRIKTNIAPETEVLEAGKLLAEARLENSPKYAPVAFLEASFYYDSAMTEWKRQNERLIILRNYEKVSQYAGKSVKSSEKAIERSRKAISTTAYQLALRIEKTGDNIKGFEENFGRFPMDSKQREVFTNCKLLYTESIFAYRSKNYPLCKSGLDSVEDLINDLYTQFREVLLNYFEGYSDWNEMVVQSISYSKKNQNTLIVIDKMSRELFVYKSGQIIKQYSIELGANWIGDKMQQGDKATPEGSYKILAKKQNGQTKYYKALLLDYPNEADKERFSLNMKNGYIKPDALIGDLIEIHGRGGTGIDWTDGCIALEDTAMDELYKLCQVGARVTIVGSIRSLNELSNK